MTPAKKYAQPSAMLKAFNRFGYWLIVVSVVGYTAWVMVGSIRKSYQANRRIADLKQQIDNLKVGNENLRNLLVYYQTNTFRELEARRRLGLKKASEKVFIIPDHQKGLMNPTVQLDLSNQPRPPEDQTANYLKWWQIFWPR